MEALAKMFFQFVSKDPQMKEGIAKACDFCFRLDARLAAIEAKVGIEVKPLRADFLDKVESHVNGNAN